MKSIGGFILLAGIGVALFVYLPAPVDSGASRDRLGAPSLHRLCLAASCQVRLGLSRWLLLAFRRFVDADPARAASCEPRD